VVAEASNVPAELNAVDVRCVGVEQHYV